MTNEEFKICQVYNHHDIENVIKIFQRIIIIP
jgi:hypothetical protein